MIEIRKYEKKDKNEAMAIWNAVVREGIAFPQDEELTGETADAFFMSQELYESISDGRADFLRDHKRFGEDITLAVEKLEEML